MNLISEELNSLLNNLVGKCFKLNRLLDRGMSLLNVRWGMFKSSELLHPALAHAFLGDKFADSISDYQGSRNNETIYPETIIGNQNYENYLEFFKLILNEMLTFSDDIENAIDAAINDGDNVTKLFLNGLLFRLVPYVEQMQDLVDLANDYGTDNLGKRFFDENISKYIKI